MRAPSLRISRKTLHDPGFPLTPFARLSSLHTHPAVRSPLRKFLASHSIRTNQNEMVQRLFDLGMVLAAGYNQPEARRALRQALSSDNLCAMCYWGLAYARGETISGARWVSSKAFQPEKGGCCVDSEGVKMEG